MRRSPCTSSSGRSDARPMRFTAERFNPARPPSGPSEGCRHMVDAAALESILKEVEQNEGVHEAMLVSLAGTYLAGSFPTGVHVDTFGSMWTVLIGSAETVTSETRDAPDIVVIRPTPN